MNRTIAAYRRDTVPARLASLAVAFTFAWGLPVMSQDVQLGPSGPVLVKPKERQPPEKEEIVKTSPNEARVSRIRLRAAPEPDPALQYVFVPRYLDVKPGNAVPYYYRAIMRLSDVDSEMLGQMQDLWNVRATEFDLDRVDRLLVVFKPVLAELRIAVHREDCNWDWRIRDRNGEEQISFLLEEIQKMRDVGRILSMKVGLHLARKEFAEATETLMMGYKMAQDIGEPAILINDLVGIAVAGVMNRRVVEFIDTPGAPNLYWAIASLPRPLISMRDSFQHEQTLPYSFFPFLRDPEHARLSEKEWGRVLKENMRSFAKIVGDHPSLVGQSAIAAAAYPRAKRELAEAGFDQDDLDSMAVAQVIAIHESRVLRRVSDEMFKWAFLPYHEANDWWNNMEIPAFDPFAAGSESLPIASLLMPAIQAASHAEVRLHAEIEGLRAVEALRLQMAHADGKIPAVLEDVNIVPVPRNPATNRPFVYHPLSKGEGRVLEIIPGKNPAKHSIWNLELVPAQ